jgi:hypothetical protein
VDIVIDYELDVGGVKVAKRDNGQITLPKTPGDGGQAAEETTTTATAATTSTTETTATTATSTTTTTVTSTTLVQNCCGNGECCPPDEKCYYEYNIGWVCHPFGEQECTVQSGSATTYCSEDEFCCHSFYNDALCCGRDHFCCIGSASASCCDPGTFCCSSGGGHDTTCCPEGTNCCGYHSMQCCQTDEICCNQVMGLILEGQSNSCCPAGTTCCARESGYGYYDGPITCCSSAQTCDTATGTCV